MADLLSAKARELISRPVLASLATLNPDGSPQITPLWIDLDGDDVVINTAKGRIKARNLERDDRVAVSVIDPADHHVTHVLLQEGHLWGRKEVAIPIRAVTGVKDGIRLNITKQQVQDLSPVDIDHPSG